MNARRRAIVTGSASGIGAATVIELARQGYDTIGIDINFAGAQASAAQAVVQGGKHHALLCDVSQEAAMVAAMAEAVQWLGGLDALATCAGVANTTPFMELSAQAFGSVYAVNVTGTFIAMREAARAMGSGGRICTVASVAGLRGGGLLGTAAYASSKGAVLALTKNAARALSAQGISVNCIAPGATYTPMIAAAWQDEALRKKVEGMSAQNRTAQPHEIAANIVYLLSPAAAYVSGATLVVDGGLTMH